jgi:chromosome segregation ATPase
MSDEIDAGNDEKLAELEAAVEALTKKNRELLGELKVSKAKAKGAEIDPEDYANLQSQVEDLQSKLGKVTDESAKTIDKLNKTLEHKDSALQGYLIDNGLSEAMIKAGVRPEVMPAVKALLKSQATIKEDGGQYLALMGDKPLFEAVSEWAAGDEGKHFVAAPANSGGGAPGSSAGASGPTVKRSSMSAADKAAFITEHGQGSYLALPR